MTRSEEELRAGTRQREAGRARLRKYVVTEDVTERVPVNREELRVEREPVSENEADDRRGEARISEDEEEVVLHEEEPVVEKRTVPKERVRLERTCRRRTARSPARSARNASTWTTTGEPPGGAR